MKYLQKSFSLAVTDRRRSALEKVLDEIDSIKRARIAKQPHKYVNGGSMCLTCTLAREAAIHGK